LKKSSATDKNGAPKYADPLSEIQDQVGARIVTFYKSDVLRIAAVVEKYFRAIEAKNHVPESDSEFSYFGKHYIFFVSSDASSGLDRALLPKVFELQIKTLFQHAWSEANHDLGYKPGGGTLTSDDKRKLAFTSAQAWGADMIFDELFVASQ
jgi:ppGpp synthetase/RelA/SpoT-type nucleotidyltranferase